MLKRLRGNVILVIGTSSPPPLQQTDLSDNEMKSRVDFPEQHRSVMDLSEEGGWIITLRKHFICCERLLLCLAPRPLPWQSICNIRDVHCKTGYVKRGCKHYLEWIGVLKNMMLLIFKWTYCLCCLRCVCNSDLTDFVIFGQILALEVVSSWVLKYHWSNTNSAGGGAIKEIDLI